jgi:putative ABC transport system permease protein
LGKIVVFVTGPVKAQQATLIGRYYSKNKGAAGTKRSLVVPTHFVTVDQPEAPIAAVIPSSVAKQLEVTPTTFGLFVSDTEINLIDQRDVTEALAAVSPDLSFYVEEGPNAELALTQLVTVGLAALLMLCGTLTATLLALSDAKPDLATLSAVGASPQSRRRVAAAYALVVGLGGALLGTLVGLVPGWASTHFQSPAG